MTNEEKAKEITKCVWFPQKCTEGDIQNMLMQMAEWKDEQFAKEKERIVLETCEKITDQAKDDYKFFKKQKQQLINKAMKVICNGCAQKSECEFKNWKTCGTKDELIKAMEE